MEGVTLSVSEFVALTNQTLEYAFPVLRVKGEVSEFRISKNRWVYFNLQDEHSSVRMFGTVYLLKQPIEDGMLVEVVGTPRLHNKYGFSLNLSSVTPSGEGSIKKAFELLKKKLEAEGLFAPERKRILPRFPQRIGLITSAQAAAYADFMKIVNARYRGAEILHADVGVQGEAAIGQVVRAINYFSQQAEPIDVVAIIRGGGSSEDLMVFSTEEVTRAVAGSRIPTVVGVGHETDVSLADLAADVRATTPTNAAQIIVPDIQEEFEQLQTRFDRAGSLITQSLRHRLDGALADLNLAIDSQLELFGSKLEQARSTLKLVDPDTVLRRGYSLAVRADGSVVTSPKQAEVGDRLVLKFSEGTLDAEVVDGKGD